MTFCQCGAQAFRIEADEEDGLAFISMWEQGTPRFTLRSKIRAIWTILRTGTPYTDQIVLDKAGVGNLIKHLSILHHKL